MRVEPRLNNTCGTVIEQIENYDLRSLTIDLEMKVVYNTTY